ncbi:MAG: exodeoxyribonuclease VII small subunit [Rhodospirillales bacterium]
MSPVLPPAGLGLNVPAMAEQSFPADIRKLSFEDAVAELEEIVRALEEGETGLDDSIAAYERGALLRRYCAKKLADAELKIEKIVEKAGGALSAEAMDAD